MPWIEFSSGGLDGRESVSQVVLPGVERESGTALAFLHWLWQTSWRKRSRMSVCRRQFQPNFSFPYS
jgi:hypothetical protein